MNDDLISRKTLIGTERLLMTDIVQNNPTAKYILEQVLFDIENAPAAFDKKKVIDELKSAENYLYVNGIRITNFKFIHTLTAIEIVEKGGIE